MILDFEKYLNNINEGLLKSYDIDFVIEKSYMQLSILNTDFTIDKLKNNTIKLTIFNFKNTLIDSIFNLLNSNFVNMFGWFPSYLYLENTVGQKTRMNYDEKYLKRIYKYLDNISIIYESKFNDELNISDKLYHISIQEHENKIIKYGIIPKTKNKISSHGNRIYVCMDLESCYNLIGRMSFYFFDSNPKINTKWVIYEINTNELDIKLYKDPNYLNKGGYLLGNIPPTNIKIIKKEIL